MYQNTRCKLKFQNGTSQEFISTCGVKQGDVLSPTLFNLYINGLIKDLSNVTNDPLMIGDTSINCLLYADDIILLSHSEEGLQKSLNTLDHFCSSWKLEVNEQKSKIMVFNSNGKTHCNYFKYKGNYLETVKSFCYLGVTIKYTGNLNLTSKLLMEKGRKAWFKIKKSVGLNNPCKLLEKLFDSLISPIILYGCEVWGVVNNLKENEPFEYLHIKFIKEILGVHCKATNVACLAELNRTPLITKLQLAAIKFWKHISSSNNSLVQKIYKCTENTSQWTNTVKEWVNKLGFSYINSNPSNIKSHIIKQRINDQATQYLNSKITESVKLNFFKSVYQFDNRPEYVDLCKYKSDRSTLCKFRISAHSLAVEKGRYSKIERQNRICLSCNLGEVEDEQHFFSTCPHYTLLRENYINKIKTCFPNIKIQSHLLCKNIATLLNSKSLPLLKFTVSFIDDCMVKRNNV